jgi:elongation factor P
MQKLGAGYQALLLYRRDGNRFLPATERPLGDLAWDYFFTLPASKGMRRDQKDPYSLDHMQANLLKGMEKGDHWPESRYVVISLPSTFKARNSPRRGSRAAAVPTTSKRADFRFPTVLRAITPGRSSPPATVGTSGSSAPQSYLFSTRQNRKRLAYRGQISMLQPETAVAAAGHACPDRCQAEKFRKTALKVIASSIRKGNVIEQDGKLYVVLTAENIHPGKGTPVSQIEMRRIGDGVKISERYKTTDQVEKATVEDHNFNYLYEDADGFHFMNGETYDQIQVSKEIVGSGAPYLQENMTVKLSLHEGNPVAIQLPQRATLEVVETEPVTKGQTASSSYKPAVLSNGVRTAVPPHVTAGTRIVVMTEDGSYVERAKD